MSKSDDIRREIEASRAAISRDYHAVRAEFDIPAKLKRTFVSNPLPWLGAATVIGFWIARPRRAAKPAKGKKSDGEIVLPDAAKQLTFFGVLIGAIRMLFPLLRPILSAYAAKRVAELAANLNR